MKVPSWLSEAADLVGKLFDAGEIDQAKAVISLRETIKAHPDYLNGIVDLYARQIFNEWQREHPQVTIVASPDDEPTSKPRPASAIAGIVSAPPKPPPPPSPRQLVQTALFEVHPALHKTYRVTPSKRVHVLDLNKHTMETAKNILWAQTQNAIDGARTAAEQERTEFLAFYDEFQPRLHGSMTVADLLLASR